MRHRARSIEMLEKWSDRALSRQRGHARAAIVFLIIHYGIGIPLVVLTAVSGALAVGATHTVEVLPPAVAVLSVIAAILAAIQTFVGAQARAEVHRIAAAEFASIRREIEFLSALPVSTDELAERTDAVRVRLDEVATRAPAVSIPSPDGGGTQLVSIMPQGDLPDIKDDDA
jgi:hypothetical protein